MVTIPTWVSLLANMEPWVNWPQQSKLLLLRWSGLALEHESDSLASDEEGIHKEGFSFSESSCNIFLLDV